MAELDSAMRGFDFADRYLNRKSDRAERKEDRGRQREREYTADKRAGESHELGLRTGESNLLSSTKNREVASQNILMNQNKIKASNRKELEDQLKARSPAEIAYFEKTGKFNPDYLSLMHKAGRINLEGIASGQNSKDVKTLKMFMSGQGEGNRENMLDVANRVFMPQTKRGIGEQTADGRTITDKTIVDIIPTDDGEGIRLQLRVSYDTGADEFHAVTDGRSSDQKEDPYTKVIAWDDIFRNIEGQEVLAAQFMSEGNRGALKAALMSLRSPNKHQQAKEMANLQSNLRREEDVEKSIRDYAVDEATAKPEQSLEEIASRSRMVHGKGTPEDKQAAEMSDYIRLAEEEYDPVGPDMFRSSFEDLPMSQKIGRAQQAYIDKNGGRSPSWGQQGEMEKDKTNDQLPPGPEAPLTPEQMTSVSAYAKEKGVTEAKAEQILRMAFAMKDRKKSTQ